MNGVDDPDMIEIYKKHMNNETTIIDLLLKQGKKIDNIEAQIGNMVTQEQHSKLTIAVLDIGEKVTKIENNIAENMVTRAEFLDSQDKVTKSLIKLEEGQAASVARDDRIEKDLKEFRLDYDNSTELMVDILQRVEDPSTLLLRRV